MVSPDDDRPEPPSQITRTSTAVRWLAARFPQHVRIFIVVNLALGAANWATGRPWWALWPLLATGVALGLHYLVYKSAVVDDSWVDARARDLNMKSYDRGHIENLKSRYPTQEKDDSLTNGSA